MSKKKRIITNVPDEQLNFVLQLLKLEKAETSVTRVGDTWTVTATFPDEKSASNTAVVSTPAPLATDTEEEALPAYSSTAEPVSPPASGNSFATLADEYRRNYDLFTVNVGHEEEIKVRVSRLRAHQAQYAALAQRTGIPWQFIAVLHMMESNCNFETHLHNGDPLTARTRRVPAGRPVEGNPPFSWEASAIDALTYEGLVGAGDWNVAAMLYRCERFNGMGYRQRGIHSPYLWSYTNLYEKGRFTRDHHFDPNSVSKQCGAAILLKRLLAES